MKDKSLDVQDALDYTGELCHETMRSLLEDIKAVLSFLPYMDNAIQEYIVGLNTWVTGLYEWSFETVRHLETEGAHSRSAIVCETIGSNIRQSRRQ